MSFLFIKRAIDNFKSNYNKHKLTNKQKISMSTTPAPAQNLESFVETKIASALKTLKQDAENIVKNTESVFIPTTESVTNSVKSQVNVLQEIITNHSKQKNTNSEKIISLTTDLNKKVATLNTENSSHDLEISSAAALIAKLTSVVAPAS